VSVNLSKGQAISLEKKDGGTLTAVRMGLGWQAASPRASRSMSSSSATW
jgi:tellurium resistance protein TerZ